MAKINGCGKRRIVAVSVLAFMLWSLSRACGEDDAAAKAEQLRAKGDYVNAVKVLAEAIKANPLDQRLADMLRDSQRILSEEEARRKKEDASREVAALRAKANAFYEKGNLDAAIRAWSRVLVLDPQDDSSAWMIQKAQARKQLEAAVPGSGEAPRDYSKKIKAIADDITKLIAQAKEKLRQEGEERKRRELAALEEDAANENRLRLEEERRSQEREEAFIAGTFKEGQELYAKGKYDEALHAWEAVLPLLAQDSELKARISVLCAEIKKERAPAVTPVETAASIVEPIPTPVTTQSETVELVAAPATAPVTRPVETAAPAVVPAPASIVTPAETAVEIVEPIPTPIITPVKTAEPITAPAPAPVTTPPETTAPIAASPPAPITPPPEADKNAALPIPTGPLRGSEQTVIAIVAIMVLAALILIVFYVMIRFTLPRRQPPAGKGFDPSKLASFLKKAKQDERRDKDIFKVK